MRSLLVVALLLLSSTTVFADTKVTFDLVRFDPPAAYKKNPWTKEISKGKHQSYTAIDQAGGTYCRIAVFHSTESKGDLDAEFRSEWAQLTKTIGVEPAQVTEPYEQDGWKIVAGVATFPFDGKTSFVTLTTLTGHGRTTSIKAETSSEDCFPAIERFLSSVKMLKPAGATATAKTPAKSPAKGGAKVAEQYMEYNTMLKQWVWKWRYPK